MEASRAPGAEGDSAGPRLPAQLNYLGGAIRESHRISRLEDNWDGEGSRGCSEATWQRAVDILVRCAVASWDQLSRRIPEPRIMPDFEGGIDLHWTSESYELVINVPADPHERVTFFGNERSRPETNKTIGEFESDTRIHPGTLAWFASLA